MELKEYILVRLMNWALRKPSTLDLNPKTADENHKLHPKPHPLHKKNIRQCVDRWCVEHEHVCILYTVYAYALAMCVYVHMYIYIYICTHVQTHIVFMHVM